MSIVTITEIVSAPSDVHHRFLPIEYKGAVWDFSHLDSFAFRCEVTSGLKVDVIVLFSSHCFTHSLRWDDRPKEQIPLSEIYDDGREKRVLSPERYRFSVTILRSIVIALPERHITIASEDRKNYMTCEVVDETGARAIYAVFFDVARDVTRKRRLILRVQSAYVLESGLSKRKKSAKKVKWHTLIKAAYEGRKIRP